MSLNLNPCIFVLYLKIIMYGTIDFEKLCLLYTIEGQSKRNSYCVQQGIPYDVVLQIGSDVNVDETWERYQTHSVTRNI